MAERRAETPAPLAHGQVTTGSSISVGRASPPATGVSTYLGSGSANHLGSGGQNAVVLEDLWVFSDFFTQQGNKVETGRAFGVAAPLGQGGIGGTALGAKGFECGEHESGVGGHDQSGLSGDGERVS